MRDGLAVRVSDMSGNPTEHITKLRGSRIRILEAELAECAGDVPSSVVQHPASHGTREVLIIYGALLTSDPGDIHKTIESLIKDRIRVSIIGLAAQVAICEVICKRTNAGDDSNYSVALNEQHFRELFMALTTPPVTRTQRAVTSQSAHDGGSLSNLRQRRDLSFCGCHLGFRVRRLPVLALRPPKSAVCPPRVRSATSRSFSPLHLARSYHHLFALRNYVEVPWSDIRSSACFSCITPFPKGKGKEGEIRERGVSEGRRYACTVCNNHFCIDCDVFAHETVHNCAGCMSDTRAVEEIRYDPMEE